jgi:hypothetical protein
MITLFGTVPDEASRELAASLASEVPGVVKVVTDVSLPSLRQPDVDFARLNGQPGSHAAQSVNCKTAARPLYCAMIIIKSTTTR